MSPFFTILLSVAVFTAVILVLVALLGLAERTLVNRGTVRIVVNDDEGRPLKVAAGRSLLSTLAEASVYLPSACGGGGTCALCKCQVLEGGGDVLPTEIGQLTRRERKDRWRLGCQVKVKSDMRIRVPEEVFGIKKYSCTVLSNRSVATFIRELDLKLDDGQRIEFKPGGYIQIDIPPYSLRYRDFDIEERFRPDWERFKLFDLKASNEEPIFRAYSMANHPAEGNRVMLNVRIAPPPPRTQGLPPGRASSFIYGLKPGDPVTVSGPYGEFFIKDTGREMVYIGGGAGMAPLRSHIFHLFHTLRTQRKVTFFYGARSVREIFYEEDFRAIEREHPNFKFHIALSEPLPEDKWTGPLGFIHNAAYELHLKGHPDPGEIEYYLCGPPLMIDAVNKMLYDLGVEREMIAYDIF